MQVVASSEELKEIAIWSQSLCNLIDLLRLLGLASALTEDDVGHGVERPLFSLPLDANKAGLLRMLQVVTVTFCDFSVHRLLDPSNLIHQSVAIMLHPFNCEAIFRVDDPKHEEAVRLQLVQGKLHENIVSKLLVCDGDATGRVSCRQLPGWISSDDIEKTTSGNSLVILHKLIPFDLLDTFTHRNGPKLLNMLLLFEASELLVVAFRRQIRVRHLSL